MTKKFLQTLLLAVLAAVPASFVFAADDAPAANGQSAAAPAKKKKGKKEKRVIVKFYFTVPDKQEWFVNYPEKLLPPGAKKPTKLPTWAELKDTPRGVTVSKEILDARSGLKLTDERPLKDVVKIEWKRETQLRQARNDLVQGNPAAALEIAERFLQFFNPLKGVDGSLWFEAAVIKLDALDRQQNDSGLDSFVYELESTPGTEKIEGLPQRIKLVRLRQWLRKGDFQRVFRESSEMIKTTEDPQTLAQLHLLKGRAEFNLGKYEDALYTFLRIPVFYGNQTEYVPASKLEVARSLLKLDTPDRAAQKLPALAESYIMEVVTEFPMTPEAKDALALLPKDKQDALAKRDALDEAQKDAAVVASITSNVSEEEGGSDSDDSSSSSSGDEFSIEEESSDDEEMTDDSDSE